MSRNLLMCSITRITHTLVVHGKLSCWWKFSMMLLIKLRKLMKACVLPHLHSSKSCLAQLSNNITLYWSNNMYFDFCSWKINKLKGWANASKSSSSSSLNSVRKICKLFMKFDENDSKQTSANNLCQSEIVVEQSQTEIWRANRWTT